ncbi:MAG: 4Fe-4S dicluster domain-containing protein, partial [Saprospiraceae bacterium]|nr:4Fe-4S dicluster domain-containing protein [Saprospiraceae bacterium]
TTEAAMYAHASVGVIHVRPILNMRDQADIDRFKRIAEDTFQLVVKYRGSWSGEHGDGLVRSAFNERFFGSQLYQVFRQLKSLFDPANIMNPGKIVEAQEIDENLRYGVSYQDAPLNTSFRFDSDRGFHNAVHMCSGVGECRKTERGTMCPSFMATRDEEHSTRGRANALRLAMSGQLPGGLTDTRVVESLDLCLSCKACKSECPSNVDMAKLKSEVWQQKYDQQGPNQRDRFIRDSRKVAERMAGKFYTPLVNKVQHSKPFRGIMKRVAGIAAERTLPDFAQSSFVEWFRKDHEPLVNAKEMAIIFADTYLKFHEPEVGIGLVRLMTQMGIRAEVADVGCCQRPRLSNGFLREAREDGQAMIDRLSKLEMASIIVCEPSCASAFSDDLPDLLTPSAAVSSVRDRVCTPADFFIQYMDRLPSKALAGKTLLLHGHCHEKALYGTTSLKILLQAMGATITEIDSGCCGMAGSFGYESEHYAISRKIAEDRLLPALRSASEETIIVSNGFSCRHQIEHFAKKKAIHWLTLFA